jgi:hypothetical protein
LNISLDSDYLYAEYNKTLIRSGEMYYFFSKNSNDVFLFFDLYKPIDNKMAMIRLGLRLPEKILQ